MSDSIYDETVTIELAALYEEMFNEIKAEVDEFDGVIEEFEPDNKLISIKVDPDVQEIIQTIVAEIVAKYEKRRKDILEKDVFCGVKLILKEKDQLN